MTQEELIEALAPIRMPIEFAEFTLRDALLALSLGIFVGVILAKIVSVFTTRTLSPIDQAHLEIEKLSEEEPNIRLVGLTRLLTQYDEDGPNRLGLKPALYDPNASINSEIIETEILRAAGSKK